MKAVLVGTFDGNKVYYDVEAKSGEKDGAIVRPDGSSVKIHFFSWASKAQGLSKIRNTKFHRSLWVVDSLNFVLLKSTKYLCLKRLVSAGRRVDSANWRHLPVFIH